MDDAQGMVLRLLASHARYTHDLRGELTLPDDRRELDEILAPLHRSRFIEFGEHDGTGRPISLTDKGREALRRLPPPSE